MRERPGWCPPAPNDPRRCRGKSPVHIGKNAPLGPCNAYAYKDKLCYAHWHQARCNVRKKRRKKQSVPDFGGLEMQWQKVKA